MQAPPSCHPEHAIVKLIIQIPCYNEEATLPVTVAELPRSLPGVDEIEYLVIDDGSPDARSQVARQLGVQHIVRQTAQPWAGGGVSDRAGGGRWPPAPIVIVNTDADNQYCGPDIAGWWSRSSTAEADIVVGDRGVAAFGAVLAAQAGPCSGSAVGSWSARRASPSRTRRAGSVPSAGRPRCV